MKQKRAYEPARMESIQLSSLSALMALSVPESASFGLGRQNYTVRNNLFQ